MGIPCKTAAGHAELAIRQRGLSQRHRTLLFLVDGRRTLEEVIELGLQAGVPKGYIDELLALGLVVMAAPMNALPVDVSPLSFSQQRDDLLPPVPPDSAGAELADTQMMGLPLSNTEMAALDSTDAAFAQARSLLLDLLRRHGPVSTTVIQLRVRRVRSREDLRTLLPEVRSRLARAGVAPFLLQGIDQAEALLNT